jgi:polar amino acid transport system substrate-binding protein
MRMRGASRSTTIAAIVAVTLLSCSLPRDADGTLQHVQNGALRLGVADDSPWVVVQNRNASGYEPTMVSELAGQLHARIETTHGSEAQLLEKLHDRKLDIVIGGFTSDSPWKTQVAFTKPYHKDASGKDHVLALPPGENAWLVRVEQFLHENEQKLAAIPQ